MRTLANSLASVCCLATLLAQDDPAVRIELRPGPLLRFDRGADETCAVRIVDALTGRPLPGAKLRVVRERSRPTGGMFWFDEQWQADVEGFVRFPASEVPERCWFFVTADGYGPAANRTFPPWQDSGIVELMPGVDWPIQVRDVFDRPLADVELGLCLGCGHTPDVRVATSDRDGLALLRGVEPTGWGDSNIRDLYPRRVGLSPAYFSETWQLGDAPTRLHVEAARFVSGRVRSPNGRPLRGVALTPTSRQHRGPWSFSDAEGTFAPIAFADELTLHFDGIEYTVSPPAVADTFDITLPVEPRLDDLPKARLTVVVQDADGRPVRDHGIDLWHVGVQSADPAEVIGTSSDANGVAVADVVAGSIGLRVRTWSGNQDYPPRFDPHCRDLEALAGQAQRVVVRLERRPTMRFLPAAGVDQVTLITRHDTWPLKVEPGVVREIPVPGDGVFALRSDDEDRRGDRARWYVFSSPPAGVVEIAHQPPTRLRMRVIDARGKPEAAEVWLLDRDYSETSPPSPHAHTDVDGRVELETEMVGCAFVRIVPDALGPRRCDLHLGLPPLGQGLLELGEIALSDAPALRVMRADGTPARGTLTLRRPGMQLTGRLMEDGSWCGPELRARDRVEASLDDLDDVAEDGVEILHADLAATLAGEGPWVLREGSARLLLTIGDDHGLLPRECVVVVGAQSKWLDDQTVELRGLPAGESEVFVGARSCESARVRVRLREGEHRRVDVVLRRAP